jgi:hypothetical protein
MVFSERQVEEATNFNLAIKEFVGLAVDERAPDHSTLSAFTRRLRAAGGWRQLEAIGDSVLRQAQAAGVALGKIQVVDSVHTVADVDNDADRQRQEQGQPPVTGRRSWSRRASAGIPVRMARFTSAKCTTWATRVTSAWMLRLA